MQLITLSLQNFKGIESIKYIIKKKSQNSKDIDDGETLLEYFIRATESDHSIKNIVNTIGHINGYVMNHAWSKEHEMHENGKCCISYTEITRNYT